MSIRAAVAADEDMRLEMEGRIAGPAVIGHRYLSNQSGNDLLSPLLRLSAQAMPRTVPRKAQYARIVAGACPPDLTARPRGGAIGLRPATLQDTRRARQARMPELPQISLHTPVGDITVSEADGQIVALDWGWGRDQTETPLLARARDQLHAYFDARSFTFDLPLAPEGTPYRRRVWAALRTIPPGQTRTYRDIARQAGGSARSVGGANGANPIPILIPCHRVVASGGLGGYSGGDGRPTKRYLLDLETPTLADPDRPPR